MTPQLISDIHLRVEKDLNQELSEPLKIQTHVNAIKGIVELNFIYSISYNRLRFYLSFDDCDLGYLPSSS
jgi:hypothetical protein